MSAPPGSGPAGSFFEAVADHARSAYLRYSFTRGTEQEVGFLRQLLSIGPGARVLDVGCGPGRHAYALARAGIEVVGVDISEAFVDVARRDAPPGATFVRADARDLDFDAEFDAAISLCQGAFGIVSEPGAPPGGDERILAGMRRALRPGCPLAVSAFSAYFQVRYLEAGDRFDAATGVNHEQISIRDPEGAEADFDLWTTCFTPRELRLLARLAGLGVREVLSVSPGAYARRPPDLDHPEFLLVAERPRSWPSALGPAP